MTDLPTQDKRQTIVLGPRLTLIVLDPIGSGTAPPPHKRPGQP